VTYPLLQVVLTLGGGATLQQSSAIKPWRFTLPDEGCGAVTGEMLAVTLIYDAAATGF